MIVRLRWTDSAEFTNVVGLSANHDTPRVALDVATGGELPEVVDAHLAG